MKVSYRWLKELVDFDLEPDDLAENLTMIGLEAEGLYYQKEMYNKIVVGQILSIKSHPKADNLIICKVDIGKERLNILSAAKNLSVGEKIPVATVQAKLPTGKKIEKVDIKGISSDGMICSAMDLDLEEISEGIMVLDKKAPIGEEIARVLKLDDITIDISVAPNRPDCLSMIGVAREIASILDKKVKLTEYSVVEEEKDIESLTSVVIEDTDLCPRYTARVVKDVNISSSPQWIQQKLRAVGLRPINNIVDITNYVLMELGQPLHAFDYDLLKENRIVVRRARDKEEITTLDGMQRILDNEALIIADSEKPVAIAGVMGGLNTLVNEKTKNILLESAYFHPISIRRASKRLKLHTESSHRFERGADIECVIKASDRAAYLFREIAGGKIGRGRIDNYPNPMRPCEVILKTKRLNQVLGTGLKEKTVENYLNRLDLKIKKVKKDVFKVKIPSFRKDLTREIDLIEEIARLYGYNNIPTALPQTKLSLKKIDKFQLIEKKVREVLINCGFFEVINYSFINETDLDHLKLEKEDILRRFIRLKNPLTTEAGIMRTTLIPGLLRNITFNNNYSIYDMKIFELGKVFIANDGGKLPQERRKVSGVISGSREEKFWYSKKEKCDFFDIKGVVELLLGEFNIKDKQISPIDVEYLYPSRAMEIKIKEERVGIFGQISPEILESFDILQDTYVFEMELEKLFLSSSEDKGFKSLPKYPALLRDIAIIVDANISSEEIIKIIKETDNDILEEIRLFDIYKGKPIPPGKKSLAYSLTYRAKDRTLTDEEIEIVHSDIIERLRNKIKAQLR